jgi:5-methylcytosine-specific restriction endonuclease McrA
LKSYLTKKRDDFKCQVCGTNKNLHTHHILYLNNVKIWNYPSNYLITLCSNCHLSEHSAFDLIGHKYKNALLSGMLSIDIYRKIKNDEEMPF